METETLEPLEAGLYLVATPIGNLEDITFRALDTLRRCHLVAAEDTRHTRKLLNHFDINVKSISYRDHNHDQAVVQVKNAIEAGAAVALVSDAGMPAISDPGAPLVRECSAAGIPLFVIPGPSAVVAAAARSGMSEAGFVFAGFPPAKAARRREFLAQRSMPDLPLIIYESPHRLAACLKDAADILGDVQTIIGREMTKLHEEWLSGPVAEMAALYAGKSNIRGEFTIVFSPRADEKKEEYDVPALRTLYEKLLHAGLAPKDALKAMTVQTEVDRKTLYNLLRKDQD